MRQLFLSITIILSGLFLAQTAFSQESVRDRIARKQATAKKQSLPELTIRAQNMNESQTQNIENAPWMREIYRILDLNKDKNAVLYYPVTPIGDRMNLFTMSFRLLAKGEIKAYEYLVDGREVFTDEYAIDFKEFLNRFSIMYTEENGEFVVDDSDVPSNEVTRYYVKEAWYFDKTNSVVDIKTLAICPVILRQDDFGAESTPYPLFWLPYEEIRPYASRMPIMTSNLNNASRQTVDDFFRKHSFEGEIYKTTNMKNLSLAQMFPNDSLVKKEQKKVEAQLQQFKNNLWAVNDSVSEAENVRGTREKGEYKAEVRTNDTKGNSTSTSSNTKNNNKNENVKPAESSSSGKQQPVRSMRNRRR